MQSIKIQFTAEGGIRMLHNDAVDLKKFGHIQMQRASHVEFNEGSQCWEVTSAQTKKLLKADFKTRSEALTWEKSFYSPGGPGWGEFDGQV